jgi:hypothetical protein
LKRFTETGKWDDPWFRSLPGVHKLVFLYIIDRCNNAGFWEIDMASMAFHTKLEEKHLEGALKGLERGLQTHDGWVWVKNFLRHQKNEVLNPSNPAHKQIISLLTVQPNRFPESAKYLPEGASKGHLSPIGIGIGQGKGEGQGSTSETAKKKRKPAEANGTIEDMTAFAVEIGLEPSDGENAFHKWNSTGWKGIKDWKSKMRTWKIEKFHPSQKEGRSSSQFTNGHQPQKTTVNIGRRKPPSDPFSKSQPTLIEP